MTMADRSEEVLSFGSFELILSRRTGRAVGSDETLIGAKGAPQRHASDLNVADDASEASIDPGDQLA